MSGLYHVQGFSGLHHAHVLMVLKLMSRPCLQEFQRLQYIKPMFTRVPRLTYIYHAILTLISCLFLQGSQAYIVPMLEGSQTCIMSLFTRSSGLSHANVYMSSQANIMPIFTRFSSFYQVHVY
jgi:hypothetical protein